MTGPKRPIFEEWQEAVLPSDLDRIAPVTAALDGALASRGADVAAREAIGLAVTEALTNAMRHGRSAAGAADIRLRWQWVAGELVVEVSEPGRFEPPPNWTELPADPLSESGRGGFLIAQAFDSLQHENAGGRHRLRMSRRLGEAAAGTGATDARGLEETLAAMTEELSVSYETLSALFGLAEALASSGELETFIEHALRLRSLVEADAMLVRLADPAGRLVLRGQSGEGLSPVAELDASGPAVAAEVFRSGSERTVEGGPHLAPEDPLRSVRGVVLVCPVYFQARRLGVCVLLRKAPREYFTAAQVSLARTTMEFLGIACATAEAQAQRLAQERAQRELEIAAQIQQSLVVREFRDRPDWRVHGACQNALEAGDDFFDVLEVDGGMLLVIADVMGKGVPAALLAVVLRTAVRAHAAHAATPAELLNRVTRQIGPDLDRLGMFITAQVVFAPANARGLNWANAGHGSLLLHGPRAGDERMFEEGGLPLGLSESEPYQEFRTTLRPGERVLLVTDGIVEAEDAAGRELGLAGLLALSRAASGASPRAACAAILGEVQRRDAGRRPMDDRTLVLLEALT